MTPPLNIPWYAIYTAAVGAAWLSSIVLRHAELVAVAARASREKEASEKRRELQRFVAVDLTGHGDDEGDADDDISVASDAAVDEHLDSGARRVFGVASLRPKQRDAINSILFDSESDGKLIVVDRTGGGKSLILQMTAICVGGVTLVIVPLLSLTANLMSRISRASCARMAVSAVHLDETSHHDLVTKVIPKLDGLSPETTESIFLLCSPQYLASNRDFRDDPIPETP